MSKRVANYVIDEKIQDLDEKFAVFLEMYQRDMHGDSNLQNGERGVIGNLREIKQYQKDYPSLVWLLRFRTKQTVTAIVVGFAVLMMLWSAGIYWVVAKLVLGIPNPFG